MAGAGSFALTGTSATLTKATLPVLDGVSGVTGAWSMSRALLTSFGAGSKYTDVSGFVSSFNDQSGSSRDFTGSVGQRPAVATAGPSSLACASFDGTDDRLTTAALLSSFMSASAGYMLWSFRINTISANDGNPYANEPVCGDTGGYMGLYIRNTASTPETAQAYNFSGGNQSAESAVISASTDYVIEWWHDSGSVYLCVNNGTPISVSSGNTDVVSGALGLGRGYSSSGIFSDVDIFEGFIASAVPASRSTIAANFMAALGMFSLSAGAGSYILTGTAATPIRRLSISAGAGSFALTGTSATLTKSASLWDPSQLGAAFVGGWRGNTLSGSDGDSISTWADWSGNSETATGGGGGQNPLLRTAALNSLNVVDFAAASSRFMTLPNFMTGFTAATIYWVVKDNADPPANTGASGPPFHGGTSASADHYPYDGDGLIYFGFGSDTRKSTGYNPSPTLDNWHIGCFRSAASDWKFFHNGVQQFTTGTNTVAFPAAPYIGVHNIGLGPSFDGRIAEIVLINNASSSTDRQLVEGYLAWKWGIQAILPGGHPYESAAPTV